MSDHKGAALIYPMLPDAETIIADKGYGRSFSSKNSNVRVLIIDEVHNLLAGNPREQRVVAAAFAISEQRT